MEMQYGHAVTIMLFMNTFCKPKSNFKGEKAAMCRYAGFRRYPKTEKQCEISQLFPTKPAALIL
jgi:hypothetical protein